MKRITKAAISAFLLIGVVLTLGSGFAQADTLITFADGSTGVLSSTKDSITLADGTVIPISCAPGNTGANTSASGATAATTKAKSTPTKAPTARSAKSATTVKVPKRVKARGKNVRATIKSSTDVLSSVRVQRSTTSGWKSVRSQVRLKSLSAKKGALSFKTKRGARQSYRLVLPGGGSASVVSSVFTVVSK